MNSIKSKSSKKEENIILHRNEMLHSPRHQYQMLEFLGRGKFGQVAKCLEKNSNTIVAIKFLKNLPSDESEGQIEVTALNLLSSVNADKYNFVRAFEIFTHKGHQCLVFEMLKQNLLEYQQQRKFSPLALKCIRPIFIQVARALQILKHLNLLHGDLKPENIMFVDPEKQPLRVKVIDFGCSVRVRNKIYPVYIQSRFYRAPEVILGLPLWQAIDMWSLGCVLAELFIGSPLYPGSTEYDQIKYISHTQGLPSEQMLNGGTKTESFFSRETDGNNRPFWRLKTEAEKGIKLKENRKYIFGSLDVMNQFNVPIDLEGDELAAEKIDRRVFIGLLKRMLTLDPRQRINADEALHHDFGPMNHLRAYSHCENVQDSFKLNAICKCHVCTCKEDQLPIENRLASLRNLALQPNPTQSQHQSSSRTPAAPSVDNGASSQSQTRDSFQHVAPSLDLNPLAKHVVPVVAAQAVQPPALQQSLLTQEVHQTAVAPQNRMSAANLSQPWTSLGHSNLPLSLCGSATVSSHEHQQIQQAMISYPILSKSSTSSHSAHASSAREQVNVVRKRKCTWEGDSKENNKSKPSGKNMPKKKMVRDVGSQTEFKRTTTALYCVTSYNREPRIILMD